MSRTIIRKNAAKKINSLLNSAVGIIAQTSRSGQCDGHDYFYAVSCPNDVLDWLKDLASSSNIYMNKR